MRKTLLLAAGLLLGFFILILSIQEGATNTVRAQVSSTRKTAFLQQHRGPGLPSIVPHLSPSPSSAKTIMSPTFTTDDVRQYLKTHPLPGQFSLQPGIKLVITRIAFLPSKEVTKLAGESTGMPDSYLLCYVELHGTVKVSGPKGATATLQKIEMAFDAQTGNLLMIGGQ